MLNKIILASKSKLRDWMSSSVVLVFPESYSKVMPSLAISAALSCAFETFRAIDHERTCIAKRTNFTSPTSNGCHSVTSRSTLFKLSRVDNMYCEILDT